MVKVLVPGGCGFIGSHLVRAMLERQDIETLVVVDNLWTGLASNLNNIRDPRLHVEICDVETMRADIVFDEIYHLASPASPPWYMSEPRRVISANLLGAMRLLDVLKPGGRFCFTSTSEVYGDPLVSPQPESYRGAVDCTGPRSSYNESKRCTESLLFETRRVSGLDLRVARLFNVYGPGMRTDDGRAISNFIVQALTTRRLTVHGDGQQTRSWGFIDDVVEALARFFWRDSLSPTGPVNIGNDQETSVLEIAEYVGSLVRGARIVHMPSLPQDPTNRRPDLNLLRQLLPRWEAAIPYEIGVKRTFDWFQKQIGSDNSGQLSERPSSVKNMARTFDQGTPARSPVAPGSGHPAPRVKITSF